MYRKHSLISITNADDIINAAAMTYALLDIDPSLIQMSNAEYVELQASLDMYETELIRRAEIYGLTNTSHADFFRSETP